MHIDLTKGDIKGQIKKLAIPASVGFFFHTMFNVTDTYFAGMISTQSLSALTLSFSIFFMMIAFAGGMSEAVTALVGNALGEKNKERAAHIALNALLFALALSCVLTLMGLSSAPYLMGLLGAEGEYLHEALAYIDIILYASVFFVLSFFINALLNAVGDTVSFRNVLIFTAIVNIFLDYWFVLGGLGVKPMGIKGIALATVIAEVITFLYLFYRVRKTPLFQSYSAFYVDKNVFAALLKQGLPPSTNMVLMATGIYIITYFAAPFGKEVLAAFGIGMRIEQIILMPAIGLNVAVLAIVSQNNGAKEFERIAQTLKLALFYGMLVSLAGMLLLLGGAEELMGVFSSDAKVIKEGVLYLRIEALILFSFVVIFVNIAMLQGIEKPAFIFYISLFRQIVAPTVLLGLFAYLGLGVLWIWLGIAAIVTLSAVMTWQYSKRRLLEASLSQK